jgi:hypothetical protein
MSDLSDLFGNVVFSYGDQQAIDDGMIVDITAYRVIVNDKPLNRASASVWAKFGDADPDATEEQHAVCRKAMFDFMASVARLTPDNPDGYLLTAADNEVWFVENEVGGYTIMYPSDY